MIQIHTLTGSTVFRSRDILVGYPGAVHDSRVFRTSPLFGTLQEKCGNHFIIGDSGYPCLQYCLTPFQDRGNLTRRQRNYNYLLFPPAPEAQNEVIAGQVGRDAGNENQDVQTGITKRNEVMNSLNFVI
ncbi:unnamed protein product [Acanthoscelides obtectus]|uniref:DDE Tnp4 domain-containing protein n=1 Tax=Acanthoscelides obtectus TaxID=200917 RepID=A0A9P0JI68_ACAOB|nr:unnamed protein product [Acanthoscelides obtectus]CAK1625044.1 hypothetical protein AOBTE_LOCUS2907 [Acanthoscelides obtectus]